MIAVESRGRLALEHIKTLSHTRMHLIQYDMQRWQSLGQVQYDSDGNRWQRLESLGQVQYDSDRNRWQRLDANRAPNCSQLGQAQYDSDERRQQRVESLKQILVLVLKQISAGVLILSHP